MPSAKRATVRAKKPVRKTTPKRVTAPRKTKAPAKRAKAIARTTAERARPAPSPGLPAPLPRAKPTKKFVMACPSGLFVLGDANDFETKWTPLRYAGQTGDSYVDFRGVGAEALTAILVEQHEHDKLADGTIRILTRGLIETETVRSSGERSRDEKGLDVTIRSAPKDVTLIHVEDATRHEGAGFVNDLGILAVRVKGALQGTIVLGDDGFPDELRITLR